MKARKAETIDHVPAQSEVPLVARQVLIGLECRYLVGPPSEFQEVPQVKDFLGIEAHHPGTCDVEYYQLVRGHELSQRTGLSFHGAMTIKTV